MVQRPPYGSAGLVVAVLSVSVAGFLATLAASQMSASRIHSLADDALLVGFPSIDALAGVRAGTREVQLALAQYMRQPEGNDAAARRLSEARAQLGARFKAYLALPLAQGEQSRWSSLQLAFAGFESSVERARELSDAHGQLAESFVQRTVEPAATRVFDLTSEAIQFHAEHGRAVAGEIKANDERSRFVAFTFGGLWALVSAAGIVLIIRQARLRRRAAAEHARFVDSRMQELESFAGRVAHDLRNPLSAANLAFELLSRPAVDVPVHEVSARGIRSLRRAEAIIAGLLEFARAGATPEPGARTNVGESVSDLLDGLRPEAQSADIDLDLDLAFPNGRSAFVACSPGVYLSCLGNLVRNAMKYMGDGGAMRRVVVHVSREGEAIRTDVSDTGPGIPVELQPSVFDPFFRARGTRQGGIGLGLATVKRLAEGHGGAVGVTSTPGRGSSFWFTMPGVVVPAADVDADHRALHLEGGTTH